MWRRSSAWRSSSAFGRAGHVRLRDAAEQFSFGADAAFELVFVNGHLTPRSFAAAHAAARRACDSRWQRPSEDGIRPGRPHLGRYADVEANPFVALNTGSAGWCLRPLRPRHGGRSARSICCSSRTGGREPAVSHPRLLVVLEEGAIGDAGGKLCGRSARDGAVYFTNAVTEIVVGQRSHLTTASCSRKPPTPTTSRRCRSDLGRDARFVSHSASIGSEAHPQRPERRHGRGMRGRDAQWPGPHRRRTARGQPHAAGPRFANCPQPRAVQACARR